MAHCRWTLALILICIPILATVITAFRVRDLPKTTHEALRTDLNRQKCDECDINELKGSQKLHSDKIESGKRYDELKKATREKLQLVNQKTSEATSKFKHISDEDDDDDGESVHFKSSDTVSKHIFNDDKISTRLKLELNSKKFVSKENVVYTNDSDGDDDDDEEDDFILNSGKKAPIKSLEKLSKSNKEDSKNIRTQVPIIKPIISFKHEDDNSHVGARDTKKVFNTPKDATKKVFKKSTEKTIRPINTDTVDDKNDSDSDDDDDDDTDDEVVLSTQKKSIETSEEGNKGNLFNFITNIFVSDDEDEDDDEEDDEDDDEEDNNINHKAKIHSTTYSKQETVDSVTTDKKIIEESKIKQQKTKAQISNYKEKSTNEKFDTGKRDTMTEKKQKELKNQIKSDIPKVTISNKEKKVNVLENDKKSKDYRKAAPKNEDVKGKPLEDVETKIKTEVKKPEKKLETESKKSEEKPTKQKNDNKPDTEHKKRTETKYDKKDKQSKETLFDSQERFSKSESHLKHVTDALQRRNLLQSEFEDFYAFFPTFAPNFSRIHNSECRRHGQIVLRQLRGTKLWAFNMLDATAKIPSGLLQGNGIQLGDYDQCLSSRARVQLESGSVVKVEGQYCLASLDVKAEHPDLELPVHLALAKNLIKSRIDDPGHFVPRFSTLSWGVCVPTACAPDDVEVVLKDALKHYQHTSGLVVRVKVDPRDCHTHDADWWHHWLELPTILTLSLYAVVILLVFVATVQDFLIERKSGKSGETDDEAQANPEEEAQEEVESAPEKKDGVLNAFSLYRSVDKLLAPCTDDEVSSIHGLRGLATLALLVAHKFISVAVTPYTNRLKITETVSSPWWSWCRAGWVFTDCFLLLSGTLTAHRTGDNTTAPWRLFQRYIRLTPALFAVVLFYAYIWDDISEGPMWGTLVTKNAEVCQGGWWWNLLYVQNYFGFEDMCAPQTHQLALDMQLTILGVAIVWAIQSEIPFSKYTIPAILSYAAYSRYSNVHEHRLTMLAYHGVSVSQLYRTARISYTSTLHRSTAYLIGLSLGLVLRKPRNHGKVVLALGWLTCGTLWSLVWWAGLDAGSTQYRYNATFAAQYASLAPIASAVAIAWVIYTVHGGQCEWLSRILSCRLLAFLSRLSYALYLTQFIVFLTKAATVRSSTEFTLMSVIDVQEISAILLSSIILTLTFVIPMQSIHKVISFSSQSDKESGKIHESKGAVDECHGKEGIFEEDRESEKSPEIEEVIKIQPTRGRQHFVAHREVLEEIPELEVEYEMQRERSDGLEEILEEEEDEEAEERVDDYDLEVIEEEQGGEDDLWEERDEPLHRRPYSRNENDDQDLDEWEWTTNGNGRYGAQHFRYTR